MRAQKKGVKTLLLVGVALAWLVSTALVHTAHGQALIHTVDAVGMTVADMDRALAFYTQVLSFAPVSDVEVTGSAYEHLQGVFGLRMRVVRLRLGDECMVLTAYLAPKGRPIPADARSHDRWFQHIAIIVSDMERAYSWLRQHKVEHASTGPQRLPAWNTKAAGIQAFYFKDPDGHPLEILQCEPQLDRPLNSWSTWHHATAARSLPTPVPTTWSTGKPRSPRVILTRRHSRYALACSPWCRQALSP